MTREWKNKLDVDSMIAAENWLDFEENKLGVKFNDARILTILGLNTVIDETSTNIKVSLTKPTVDNANGTIVISGDQTPEDSIWIHEVVRYLLDVGLGKKVTCSANTLKNKKKDNLHEQIINYITMAILLRRKDILKEINKYDANQPKIDELAFVAELCENYGCTEKEIIRRIQEVRKLQKAEYVGK